MEVVNNLIIIINQAAFKTCKEQLKKKIMGPVPVKIEKKIFFFFNEDKHV